MPQPTAGQTENLHADVKVILGLGRWSVVEAGSLATFLHRNYLSLLWRLDGLSS